MNNATTTTWHCSRTNPLDNTDTPLTGSCGAHVLITQNMRGEFTVSVDGPVTRRFEGLSNMQACQVLNTWNATFPA